MQVLDNEVAKVSVNRDRFLNAVSVLDRMAAQARMPREGCDQLIDIFHYLKDVYEPLHSQRQAIFEVYGTKDENGNLLVRGNEFVVPPAKQEELTKKLQEWAAGAVEVPADIMDRLDQVHWTVMELRAIENGLKPQEKVTPRVICSGKGEIINPT